MAIEITLPADAKVNVAPEKATGVVPPVEKEETKSAAPSDDEAEKESDESDPSESDDDVESDESSDEEDSEETEDGDEDPEAKPKEEDQKPKKNGVQKRIDKLRARESRAREEAEYWKQEALRSRSADPTKPVETAKPASKDDGPNPDDFETFAEYDRARIKFEVKRELDAEKAAAKAQESKTQEQKRVEAFQAEVKKFQAKHEDFAEVIDDVDDIEMSLTVKQLFLESDHGPALMYELAKNREEYARVCKLPPLAAARAIGQIEARLTKQVEAKPEIKKTKAPAPIAPVNSRSGSAPKSIFDPTLSQREYEALRERQIARREAR